VTSCNSITFNPQSILWRSRGYHWDFEFISTPSLPRCRSWWKLTKDAFREVDSSCNKKIIYGVVDFRDQNQKRHYFAAYFIDADKVDWTGRSTQHFLIWFPPETLSEGYLYQNIPADWFEQIFEKISDFLYQDEIFYISEKQLKERLYNSQNFHIYLKEKYEEQVKSFVLQPNVSDKFPVEWLNIDLVKE